MQPSQIAMQNTMPANKGNLHMEDAPWWPIFSTTGDQSLLSPDQEVLGSRSGFPPNARYKNEEHLISGLVPRTPFASSRPQGSTALHLAAQHGQKQVVSTLLSLGADPHVVDCAGRCAIHIAAAEGYDEIVKLLAFFGADLNIVVIKQ
jgi:ankyrin repeat protein